MHEKTLAIDADSTVSCGEDGVLDVDQRDPFDEEEQAEAEEDLCDHSMESSSGQSHLKQLLSERGGGISSSSLSSSSQREREGLLHVHDPKNRLFRWPSII